MNKQTALDWYWDKIKSHFEHDGDLFETATFTFAIAKQKEREQMEEVVSYGISNADMTNNRGYFDFDKYYNKTYKAGEQ